MIVRKHAMGGRDDENHAFAVDRARGASNTFADERTWGFTNSDIKGAYGCSLREHPLFRVH
jgi:hypothetical protein